MVDGDVWQTTMVLTNTTAASAVASLSFFQETGTGNATAPWSLSFLEMSSAQAQAITLAPGETLLLHTPDTAPTLSSRMGPSSLNARGGGLRDLH